MKSIKTALIILTLAASCGIFAQAKNNMWVIPSMETAFSETTNYEASGKLGHSEDTKSETDDFTPSTDYSISNKSICSITFSLVKPGFVNIKIYDEKGNVIDELARSSFGAGSHEVKWNSSKFSAGSFYYSLITEEYSKTKKIK
jgi:flagellar hook assembly protein FlgD